MNEEREFISIVDYGSQYTQLIARRIREKHVFCKIVPCSAPLDAICGSGLKGIVLSGGPNSVFAEGAPGVDPALFESGVPVLGICYGMQLMAQTLGGTVEPGVKREYGSTPVKISEAAPLFAGTGDSFTAWMSHGDRVASLPPGFKTAASSASCPAVAMKNDARRLYAIQFHPEVAHTQFGGRIIENFLFGICGCSGDWKMSSWIERSVAALRERIGDGEVLLGLSGGVDSSVVAALLDRAIGRRLHCIFVDNGLLRWREAEEISAMFGGRFSLDLRIVRAADRFYNALAGITDPELKRKAVGREFVAVFTEEARRFSSCRFLAQGTIYPDVVESSNATGAVSHTIKSHHNVGGLPPDLKFELVEPLRDLFKDEVRAVGRELGLDADFIDRQPFPGPGLSVRIVGEVTPERVHLLQQADVRVQEEMRRLPGWKSIWQSFAVLLPVRTVGVMGDCRTYENVCALRCVDSQDAMTADWTRLPYETLATISRRITNEVRGINRVVYDITSKPPSTIEWE
ncbi:MAG: glutamine-hydrolyzing GMP synthase [Kiritimatiellae bacterium]|nr:glutamine-hydrolyzing GMP synthase [Kiritimatiellia bacterium]